MLGLTRVHSRQLLRRSKCWPAVPVICTSQESRTGAMPRATESGKSPRRGGWWWGCLCRPLPASLPLSISELQILQPLWLWSLPQQENSSSATCGLMLTVDENNSKFPVGAVYQESELTYHNRVPQARSWTFGSPTILPSPPTPSPPGVKKQPWISVRPAANH